MQINGQLFQRKGDSIMAKFVAAGKYLFKFWNDPMGCYFYYSRCPYEIQNRNYEVQEALEMMATMIAI
jgi:hypothetical protein